MRFTTALAPLLFSVLPLLSQTPPSAQLTQIQSGRVGPSYPIAYAPAEVEEIQAVLQRIHSYLDRSTPPALVNRETGVLVTDLDAVDESTTLAPADFRLVSYEWGVTYAGMLLAADATGDARYRTYVDDRMAFIARAAPAFRDLLHSDRRDYRNPFHSVLRPRTLNHAGSMAAAMIKAVRAGNEADLHPHIERYLDHISLRQKRLADGTLARDRPLPDSLWLDDLYMSVPALAQMALLTGDTRYFDDAVTQVRQFTERMFVEEEGLYMHAWVEGMAPHPVFHWGRANGWAIVALTELLSVLPEDHPGHAEMLEIFRRHCQGLAAKQGLDGRWHQLLDRPETYPETSCTAMFTYCLARGINRGWLDPLAYGPAASAGWNAAAAQVNAEGQVEGTCVGTGMGFDPVFYAYRPISVYAAHGYGPLLLAGAEMITLRRGKGSQALISDGAVQFAPRP